VTSGIVLPDGYFRILDMTRENAHIFEWLENRDYIVEEYVGDQPDGLYREDDGKRYTTESVMAACDLTANQVAKLAAPTYVDPAKSVGLAMAPRRSKVKAMAEQKQVEGRLNGDRKSRRAA
jgi:hypothetical protein